MNGRLFGRSQLDCLSISNSPYTRIHHCANLRHLLEVLSTVFAPNKEQPVTLPQTPSLLRLSTGRVNCPIQPSLTCSCTRRREPPQSMSTTTDVSTPRTANGTDCQSQELAAVSDGDAKSVRSATGSSSYCKNTRPDSLREKQVAQASAAAMPDVPQDFHELFPD